MNNDYMEYIKCGEVLISPTINYKERYILRCSECNAYFSFWDSFLDHSVVHYNENNEKDIEIKSNASDEIDVQHDPLYQSLNDLGQVLKLEIAEIMKTTNSLKRHTRKHVPENNKEHEEIKRQNEDNKEKEVICPECGKLLKTRKNFKRHLRIHMRQPGQKEETKGAKFECEICRKVYQQSSTLKDHLRTHTGEHPFLCSECGKVFTNNTNLKQHLLRHGTGRPYECPDCPKTFRCRSDLASHKIVHSKDAKSQHVCDICGKGFALPYLLRKHKMYHNGEKNHKCDYCDMRFVLAEKCRRHMRTHTGEKPYKCKYCIRAYAQSNDLIKHLRGHLGDNVYKCNLCPQGFRLQCELRAHFNTHKNDDEETKLRNLQALKDEQLRLQMKLGLVQADDEMQ